MPYSYHVQARSPRPPSELYAALVRPATWPAWSPIDAASVDGGGDPAAPQGVGAVRIFRTGRSHAREQILELVPGRRFVYANLGGPFRSYRGVVDLAPAPGGGTAITWTGTFEPKVPLTGRLWQWFLTRFMQRMADGLAGFVPERAR